jgi:diguanylate cyclase (GGDEF)-like protein/PAS domain S-box-containing protein
MEAAGLRAIPRATRLVSANDLSHHTEEMNRMQIPSSISSERDNDAQRLARLLRWMLWLLFVCGLAILVASQLFSAVSLFWYSVLIIAYVSLLVWARQQLSHGHMNRASLAMSVGMLLCSAVSVIIIPDTAPAATLVPLLAIEIALPYLTTRTLRALIVVTWFVTGLVVVLAETTQLFPRLPPPFPFILHLEVIVVTPLISWLLWQHHLRLTHLLHAAQTANRTQQQAHVALEAQIDERKQREEELHQAEVKYRSLIEHIPAIIYRTMIDAETPTLYISPQVETLLGFSQTEWQTDQRGWLTHLLPLDWMAQRGFSGNANVLGDLRPIEFRVLTRDGRIVWFRDEVTLSAAERGQPAYLHGIMFDITERKHAEEQLLHLALYDPLTDLPNRTLFMDRIKQAFAEAQRQPNYQFAVLFLDLDRFKDVNDRLGHRAGDALLGSMAQRLQHCLRATDTIARLGGDEFAILLTELGGVGDAIEVAERIQQALATPFSIHGQTIFMTTSIGVALNITIPYTHPDEIVRDADTAMYHAKNSGRAAYVVFDPHMHVAAMVRLDMERDLRYALERDEFVLYYQPQVDLRSGQIIGVEALIRWQHPERGLIAPAEFIPIAEETGLIVAIGEWGLQTACQQGKAWHTAGLTGLKVAVNLSARQFKQQNLHTRVAEILASTAFDPKCLEVELTESDTMEQADASVSTLHALKSLGIGIAIDDFGTGYSSLSYLQKLPIDVVKIDRSFVQHCTVDANDRTIAQTIIAMAHSLHLQVIAEGVETVDQRGFLAAQGCEMAQGYLFSRPLPADQILPLLQAPLYSAEVRDGARVCLINGRF